MLPLGRVASRDVWIVGLLSATLVAYPPMYALLHDATKAGFGYVTGDSFLYLTIARNSDFGWFSFDGKTATNGFHPLWQYLLTALFHDHPVDAAGRQVSIVTLLSTLCTALGVALSNVAVLRFTGSRLLALLSIPGIYYVLMGGFVNNLSVWDHISGMEGGISVLCGGTLLFLASSAVHDRNRTVDDLVDERGLSSVFLQMGCVLPFFVLSRLDDVFVLAALGLVPLMLSTRPLPKRIMASVRITALSAAAVAAFMIHGKLTAGAFLPISAMTKAGFVLPKSLYIVASTFLPFLIDVKNAVSVRQSDPISFYENTFRGIQLLFPGLIALAFLYSQRALYRASGRSALLCAFSVGVIIKVLYNFANVHLWHQGPWYFAFNVLFVSVMCAIMLEEPYRAAFTTRGMRLAAASVVAGWMALTSARHAIVHAFSPPNFAQLYWAGSEKVARGLREKVEAPLLLAFDDGLTGYALPFPTIHAFGFAADLETHRALREKRLLAHAYDRGHRILTSGGYMQMLTPIESSDEIRAYLKASVIDENTRQELDGFDFHLLHIDADLRVPFIQFWPRGATNKPTPVIPKQNASNVIVAAALQNGLDAVMLPRPPRPLD